MKYLPSSQQWRASARLRIQRLSAISVISVVVLAITNSSLLWFAANDVAIINAAYSERPIDFEVVPGNGRLYVSWRPSAEHRYQLRWRAENTLGARWNVVPGLPDLLTGYRYEITGLANDTEYDVQVRGISDQVSTSSPDNWSDWTDIKSEEPRSLASVSNDDPSWRKTVNSVSIKENLIPSHAIATFEAIGGDTNDIVNYEILNPVRGPFAMNAANGEVYVYEKLDFEMNEQYSITIAATDLGGASIEHSLTINVVDLEGPPIPSVKQVCAGNGQAYLAWDQSNTSTYDIRWARWEDGNRNYSVAGSFNLRSIDADRKVVEDLTNGVQWIFQLRAVDKQTGEQSKWSAEYLVQPSADESRANNAPSFSRDNYIFSAGEELEAGLEIGQLSAYDEDSYDTVRYSLSDTDPPNAPFEIDEFKGVITTTEQLDYEMFTSYTLTVIARDLCGLEDQGYVTVTVANAIEADVPAVTPSAPAVAVGHEQVVVLWDNFTDFRYDLDWRRFDERYGITPKDQNASSPRVIEVDNPDIQYAFRIRTRNLLGQIGAWSPETVVTPLNEAPTVLPVTSPQESAVLGHAVPYQQHINLRKGQDTFVGVNLFNVDGGLDNSIFDRDDVTIRWTASIGDFDETEARSTIYTAPHRVGDFAVYANISQEIPDGAVNLRLRIPVRIIGEDHEVQIYTGGEHYPTKAVYRGDEYEVVTYSRGGEISDPNAPGASFIVPAMAIPVRDWISARLIVGSDSGILKSNVRRFRTIGNWYKIAYISSDELPLTGMAFTPHAEVCLPVPQDISEALDDIEIMLLLDNGMQQLLNSPIRHLQETSKDIPARVCARASTFDGTLFLVQPETREPTATAVPPTVTPTLTPDIVSPTATLVPTSTPVPPPVPTAVVFPPTETPIPTQTPTFTPTATATHTPIPNNTPTPIPTATQTSTAVPTNTLTPTSTPVPTDTPTLARISHPTAEPTRTSTPTNTATPLPTKTPTIVPTDTPIPIPATVPPSVDDDESSSTSWIIAIVAIMIVAGAIAGSAAIYRARIASGNADRDNLLSEIEVEQEDDDMPNDGDESSKGNAEEDYDVLRYDMPRSG